MNRHLIVLGCSATKNDHDGLLPAVIRYDGPLYRVLRSYLRISRWPDDFSVGVLSAKYGLIGGLTPIEHYDQRMTKNRAVDLRSAATGTLVDWSGTHKTVSLILGKDYLHALNLDALNINKTDVRTLDGPIGIKLNKFHGLLRGLPFSLRSTTAERKSAHPLYFLPDWDDILDADFDFKGDKFSTPNRGSRNEVHCIQAMKPHRICDGVLVSLAQNQTTKGILRKFGPTDIEALAPESIRQKFGLTENQWAFGDCGAFSYINEDKPIVSVEEAAAMYQLYGFDLGASVDHIPVPEITTKNGKKPLSIGEQRGRILITQKNAELFIELHRKHRYTFAPVGVIQGLTPESYGDQLHRYVEMGYQHIAFGGLVPRSDTEIIEILKAIKRARAALPRSVDELLWTHLFGVFRPRIQSEVRNARITSFDSATYFRKAWLRSDQNYLGTDGNWYAAIRVPMTSDPRTRKRLKGSGVRLEELERREKLALKALQEYGNRRLSLESTLNIISEYDFLLTRSDDHGENLIEKYRETLESRVWDECSCRVCSTIGVHALIFRGYNRNKRRGAHNTLMLYRRLNKT